MNSADSDVTLAVAAAEAGATVVADGYGGRLTRLDKGGGDFATDVDIAAERAITAVLRAARPGDAVTGEESGSTGAESARRRWLVDPLCGTLNYAVRNRLVAVNIALRVAEEVTAAAVADPFGGDVLWVDGNRAGVRRAGADAPVTPSAESRLVDVNLDPPFPNAPGFRAVELLARPGFVAEFRPRVVSSTIALAWVATGQRAAYVTDGAVRDSVHFAAGIALCRAAGCVVTGLDGGPLTGGSDGLVAAADASTHARLLGLIGRT